jgi:preprotein translocase subunit SecF
VEIFKQVSINWLSKKWWFFGFSWLLIALGAIGYYTHGGLEYGIDFTGGTIIKLKFKEAPDLNLIRQSLAAESATPPLIQRYGLEAENEVQIRMQTLLETDQGRESGRDQLLAVFRRTFDPEHADSEQADFNTIGLSALHRHLLEADPDQWQNQSKTSQEIDTYYESLAQSMLDYRDQEGKGLVGSLEELKKAPGVSDAAITALNNDFFAGPFAIKGLESVGAVVGTDLRRRAQWAVGFSFLAMLVYIAFRFKPIYGVAAVIALFHDLAITIGLFALTQKEISLTVIAAFLTLVGYSMNDSIVVFDRVRENLRTMRKESLYGILNLSVNQTLARTIMTSGMTFLSVFALFVFGGEVLNGFSFALTVGIIIGTYSSIGIACPIVDWWYRTAENRSKRKTA